MKIEEYQEFITHQINLSLEVTVITVEFLVVL